MAKRKHTAEEIIHRLREVEVISPRAALSLRLYAALVFRSRPSTAGGLGKVVSGSTKPGVSSNWKRKAAGSSGRWPN